MIIVPFPLLLFQSIISSFNGLKALHGVLLGFQEYDVLLDFVENIQLLDHILPF